MQQKLRSHITLTPLARTVHTIAGADISFNKYEREVFAGIAVFSYPDLTPVAERVERVHVDFPYIPGLLSFREIPALLAVWKQLPQKPDVVMVDGHGIAHPRRMGIATHFGIVAGVPTIGCAKSVLTGTYRMPGEKPGARTLLKDNATNETLGIALRTRLRAKPIFISPGTGLTLDDARAITTACLRGYRLPEPTRAAHLLTNAARRAYYTSTPQAPR